MFIRQQFRTKNGQRHAYWALVESYRTASGPRQRVVKWLGKLDEAGRLGVNRHVSFFCGHTERRPIRLAIPNIDDSAAAETTGDP
jgi:hypothetical protein